MRSYDSYRCINSGTSLVCLRSVCFDCTSQWRRVVADGLAQTMLTSFCQMIIVVL